VADVLLTHSYHLAYDRKQVRKMQPYLPLGTLYAASVLRSHGISVAVFDTMLHDPITGFPAALEQHTPKVVAIYEDDFNFLSKMCLTRMREVASWMTEVARRCGAQVIAHGSDATDHAEDYLRHGANCVLVGEAEITLTKLCRVLLGNGDPQTIEGVVSLDSSSKLVQQTPALPKAASWVNLPTPARDLIDIEPYRRAWTTSHGYFSINVVASRGCPYRCNWCAKPISGDRFHVRPAEAVADEILQLKQVYGAEHIWFSDDVFALNHQWARQFALEMEKRECMLPFKIQSRADLMTAETVESLKRAGCIEVWMGVESGSQKVLDAMDKGLLVSEVASARKVLRESGIRACYFLQFGYPGETWSDIQQTIALVRTTRPDDIGVSVSYPLPNTPFYYKVQAELGRKRNWTDSDDLCVMFTAEYKNEFYHALRDALHAEVDSWHGERLKAAGNHVESLWQQVMELEPVSKNASPTSFRLEESKKERVKQSQFLPLGRLSIVAREA
jgi:anaerobic magnesium-protoporphyrin IX monomethyl ester cyclase